MLTAWTIDISHASPRAFEDYEKRHRREFDACFNNLDKIIKFLNAGLKMGGFQVGFLRSEGRGLYRVGQTGVPGARATRLYVYPDVHHAVMYILGIGDKDTQHKDIAAAHIKTDELRRQTT